MPHRCTNRTDSKGPFVSTLADALPLNTTMLDSLGDVPTPRYDRSSVTAGIVHFGVGGFHRAHQAFYLDQLLASDPSWGICGVGVRPADARMRDALVPQDGLYTLTLKHPDGAVETSVIGESAHERSFRVGSVRAPVRHRETCGWTMALIIPGTRSEFSASTRPPRR